MKLSKCILLASVALSASFASANCKDAAQDALNKNRAKDAQLAEALTSGKGQSAQPQNDQATGAQREG